MKGGYDKGRCALAWALAALFAAHAGTGAAGRDASNRASLDVSAVDTVGMTVSDMEHAVAFYTTVLDFEKVSDEELAGRDLELLTGVFGARARSVRLSLGGESIELTEFLAPKGRPMTVDVKPNDRVFQHIAIIVSDIGRAYDRLRSHQESLFLGIDHTAIVVDDTDRALAFYRDALGLEVAGESENFDVEQERLNGVFGARLRITALRAAGGPGVELLEYLAPRDGRPAPVDLKANDIAHWQTTFVAAEPERVFGWLRSRLLSLVSPSVVALRPRALGIERAVLVRDPDGHGVRLAAR
jgi:catechol 2,3-dioxygenase-like lactoylglutathione lyase family enzyme